MRNILIPIDFSPVSINALDYAVQLFKDTKVQFHLLTIYISSPSILLGDDYNEAWFGEMDDDVSIQMKELVEQYNKKSNERHSFIASIQADSILNAIKNTITSKSIDLFITGTKGVSSVKETFVGSNSLKMIKTIDACPVLIVPGSYRYTDLQQIVFSTNYKRPFNGQELKSLIQLGVIKQALIEVVCLSEDNFLTETQKKNKIALQEILESLDTDYKKLEWSNSETETIENHTENTKSGLLALINHKHNFFYRLTKENVIKKVTFHSKVPILILPEIE